MNKKVKDKEEKENKKVKEEIKKEIKEINNPTKKKKIFKKKPEKAFKEKEAAYNSQRIKYAIELTIIIIFSLIMILLLCNRTFFKEEYKTSKISLNIPLLMYFEKDDGSELVMKTLRKSQYVKDFFDGELESNTKIYRCQYHTFYYNEKTQTAIYSIDVSKDWGIKTVKIKYAHGDDNCLCNTEFTGKKAT